MEFNNYENKYEVAKYINNTVVPFVYENLVDAYGFGESDYDGDPIDHIWEIVDGLEEVIYNYQARKVSQAFDYDAFNTLSEMTGERFNSYNEMSFEIIYYKVLEAYSEQIYAE